MDAHIVDHHAFNKHVSTTAPEVQEVAGWSMLSCGNYPIGRVLDARCGSRLLPAGG